MADNKVNPPFNKVVEPFDKVDKAASPTTNLPGDLAPKAADVQDAPVASAAKVVVAKKAAVVLTTDDRFILKDTNNDGIPDIIVIEHLDPKAEAAKADTEKYAPYNRALTNAARLASSANAGKSANEIAAAVNVAVAKAKADWKGPKPPVTPEDKVQIAADKAAADNKAAIAIELDKINNP